MVDNLRQRRLSQSSSLFGLAHSLSTGCLVTILPPLYNMPCTLGSDPFSATFRARWGRPVPDRPRILVFEGASHVAGDLLQRSQPDWELIRVESVSRGLDLLHSQHFDGIYAETQDPVVWSRAENILQAERILEALADGVSVVTPDFVGGG